MVGMRFQISLLLEHGPAGHVEHAPCDDTSRLAACMGIDGGD
jgi:hypothetical protein